RQSEGVNNLVVDPGLSVQGGGVFRTILDPFQVVTLQPKEFSGFSGIQRRLFPACDGSLFSEGTIDIFSQIDAILSDRSVRQVTSLSIPCVHTRADPAAPRAEGSGIGETRMDFAGSCQGSRLR